MSERARARLGAWIWLAVPVLNVVLQLVVVAAWPVPYSIAEHTVSDLGYTTCGAEERPNGVLETCSPLHLLFNAGGVVQYALLGAGAVLLRARFGWPRTALVALLAMAGSGIAVSLVPGDVSIEAHALLALPLFLGAPVALAAAAWSLRRAEPVVAAVAAAAGLATVAGIAWLGFALVGLGPVGLAERLAAESVYAWVLIAGAVALVRPRRRRPRRPR